MKILIMGMDGYLGWPLAMHLAKRGHIVAGVDNFSRRSNVERAGSWSAIPICSMGLRISAFEEITGIDLGIDFREGDITDWRFTSSIVRSFSPHAIIQLAEIPSAPYSMIDIEHCNQTQMNNIIGTNNILWAMKEFVPDCHLVKLGTMGEYGTPNLDIPEGYFEIEYRGRRDRVPFPRQAGSFYHLSKVHGSHNIMLACKIWGLRSTDIMQGVVHGIDTEEIALDDRLVTRFDFDEIWGTALNRFCAEAVIGHDLTPYGKGGQTRGYISLRDSIQCLTLVTEKPAKGGEYRPLNQFDECYSVNDLAVHVKWVCDHLGIMPEPVNIKNPRVEAEDHYYNPDHGGLYELGFRPTHTLDDELMITLRKLMLHKDRIEEKKHRIMPTITWK